MKRSPKETRSRPGHRRRGSQTGDQFTQIAAPVPPALRGRVSGGQSASTAQGAGFRERWVTVGAKPDRDNPRRTIDSFRT